VCMFANTPDGHFIIDHHPEARNVIVAAGFSGHGFKFCGVVGEIAADLAIEGSTKFDVDLFRMRRPTKSGGSERTRPTPHS
jgi:sarcosine oxidase